MADEGWVAPGTGDGERLPQRDWATAPGADAGSDADPGAGADRSSGPYVPPSSPPPPPGRVRRRVALGVLVAAALAAGGIGGGMAVASKAEHADELVGSRPSAEAADVDLVPFHDPLGAYEVSIPQGWVAASLEGDVSGVGAETFPNDPAMAEEFQRRVSSIPRALIFVSLDPDEMAPTAFTSNFNIIRVPGSSESDLDDNVADVRRTIRASGGHMVEEGSFTTAAGEATRLEYEGQGPVSEIAGISYVVAAAGEVWGLTFSTDDLSEEEPVADAVAATFAPGLGG